MKNFYLFLLLTVTALPIFANPGIKGKVIDNISKQELEYAQIVLYANEKMIASTVTLSDGSFTIPNISAGEYTLSVRMLGYDLYTGKTFTLSQSTKDLGIIPLSVLEVGLNEIEVVAQKKQVIYKLDKRVIEASSNLLASGGTAVDILENTPSIRINAEGEVTFRGSSGFAVYIDGRPSIFSGSQALQQIPASQIQNIEIITTPSAKNDTGGDVGMINIITKKNFEEGVNGIVNVTGSTVRTRAVDFMLVGKKGASQWNIGGYAGDRKRKSKFDQKKTTLVNDTTTISHSNGPRTGASYAYSINGGWNYSSPKTSYSIGLEGGYAGWKKDGNLDYTEQRWTNGQLIEQGLFKSLDNYDQHETYGQGNLGFEHKFNDKGHILQAGFYLKYGGDALEYFESNLYDAQNVRQQGHRAWEAEHRWTVRGNLDYVFPYRTTGQLKAGYQYYSYLENGDYSMQFWNPDRKEFYWRNDIYNTFYFQQGINSLYGIVADSFGSFDFQAGVRGEHTHQVLRSSKEWANRFENRFELFPSIHLGYNLPNKHKLQAAYSRRTTRPELYFMEPYITFHDYYTAEIGNPDIRPEYIHSFELNYSWSSEKYTFTSSVFHRNRKDKIERIRVPYTAGVTLDSMANVGHDYSTGIELSGSASIRRWWNMNANSNIYRYKVKNEFRLGDLSETSTNYDIYLNNTFDVGKSTRIQADGNFVGPSVTTQGRTDSFWYINLGIRQQLIKRKLTGTLSFRDVFNTARYTSNITSSNLNSATRIKPCYPLISLTLSYTFNQDKQQNSISRDSHDLFEGTSH